jgi:hypothetical protein
MQEYFPLFWMNKNCHVILGYNKENRILVILNICRLFILKKEGTKFPALPWQGAFLYSRWGGGGGGGRLGDLLVSWVLILYSRYRLWCRARIRAAVFAVNILPLRKGWRSGSVSGPALNPESMTLWIGSRIQIQGPKIEGKNVLFSKFYFILWLKGKKYYKLLVYLTFNFDF